MYTSPSQVRLILSSDAEETGGTAADLSDDQIQFEIDSAAAMIDAELRVQYVVPFAEPVPFIITSVCTDIASYRTDLNFRKSREYDSQNMPIIQRYNMAVQTLADINAGRKTLSAPRTDVGLEGGLVVHQYQTALFDPGADVFGPWSGW